MRRLSVGEWIFTLPSRSLAGELVGEHTAGHCWAFGSIDMLVMLFSVIVYLAR